MICSEEAPGGNTGSSSAAAASRQGLRLADLGPRLGSAAVLIAIAVGSWWVGGLVFVLAWLIAAVIVDFEWQRIVGGRQPNMQIAIGSGILVATAIALGSQAPMASVFILAVGAAVTGYVAGPRRQAWSGLGVLYAGAMLIAVLILRSSFPFGRWSVGWLFAVVWGTDACAYFAGRLIGGPKFLPHISPSKTWSGTGLGVLAGGLIGLGFLAVAARVSHLDTLAPSWALFFFGLVLAAVSQGGDLFESWLKRRFGAKDSGNFIPGHGGLLDRLDGFTAAVVLAVIIGMLRAFPTPAEGLFHWM